MRAGPQQGRLAKLRKLMKERRIGAFLVTQRENVRYLTGFTGSSGSVIVGAGRPVLITDFRYQVQSQRETTGLAIHIQTKDHPTAVQEAAVRLKADVLWYDEAGMTLDRARALRKKGLTLRGVKDPVAELRKCKDRQEIRLLSKAIGRAEEAFRQLRRHVRPGATERELGLRLEWLMREQGARRVAFDLIVASGRNGAMPHASVTGRRLRSGDLVTFDFGAEADGYFCDLTRTICVGKPSAQQQKVHALVLRAQQAAIGKVAPGVACRDVDRAARDVISTAGHGKHFGHATGHGIGLMVHEGPALSSRSPDRLEAGMVVTVEPGVYIPGWGGVRIEDMVLVTEKGARVLTSLSRDL